MGTQKEQVMLSRMAYIAHQFPHRNDNVFIRTLLWNAIGYERKFRARQSARYPLRERFM